MSVRGRLTSRRYLLDATDLKAPFIGGLHHSIEEGFACWKLITLPGSRSSLAMNLTSDISGGGSLGGGSGPVVFAVSP